MPNEYLMYKVHMGICAEKCATEYNISREDQDRYAIESYKRAREAMELDFFNDEIVSVEAPKKRGKNKDDPPDMVDTDEEPDSVKLEKLPTLRSAFKKDGTVKRSARMTAFLNGVLVQDNVKLTGPTSWLQQKPYEKHADAMPIKLQDHDSPVRFRNIWIRPLPASDKN